VDEALPVLVGHCDRLEPSEAGDECHVHVELGLACQDLAGRACHGHGYAVE
jgi:hypothetical protein